MAKNVIKVDSADGRPVGEVGRWALEKHDRLRNYIDAAGPTRAKYVPPKGRASASYIELYCGAGRSLISGTSEIIDGSALVAYKAGRDSAMPFTDLHLSDLEEKNVDAAAQRVKSLGGVIHKYHGPADETVSRVLRALNPYGLHLAFLDPFSLGQLPFSIIEKMLRFRRMDMIIHVSLLDLQRNLDDYSSVGDPTLDNFAPRWRESINLRQAIAPLRAALIEYWMSLIRSLGSKPATGIPLVVGGKNQRLYWLVFLSVCPKTS